jgi:EAL and modified HD-GYP domain-containing signal transduction protein
VEVFVARQAIFDRHLKIFGYELLFRSCQTDSSDAVDGSSATLQVITNSFLSIGVDRILAGGKAFVNCPQALLDDERLALLPQAITVVEVLETVQPDPNVIAACRRLKDMGYTLALDDFIDQPGYEGLIELADIIKVDFRELTVNRRRAVCEKYGKRGIRMLAEKVETREEFQQALEMGYDYYQGYFFARPVTLRSREIAGYKANYLSLLREIHKPEIDRARIAELIQREASLAYRLLRYINSAAFDRLGRVSSIPRALALLGDDGIRKWTWLAALPNLAVNKPSELMVNASIRARFCELIAPAAGLENRQADLFLMGMLSRLDAMLDRSLDELLPELRLPRDLEEGLLRPVPAENPLAAVYAVVRAYEAAEWQPLLICAADLRVPADMLPKFYLESVNWAEQQFKS